MSALKEVSTAANAEIDGKFLTDDVVAGKTNVIQHVFQDGLNMLLPAFVRIEDYMCTCNYLILERIVDIIRTRDDPG